MNPGISCFLVCAEWKQSDSSCSLNSEIDFTLMFCACSGYAARKNLTSFGNETAKCSDVFVINGVYVIYAALADLSSRSSCSISSDHASYILQNQCISERNLFFCGRSAELTKTALWLSLRLLGIASISWCRCRCWCWIAETAAITTAEAIVEAAVIAIALTAAETILLRTRRRSQRNRYHIGSHFRNPSSLAILAIIGASGVAAFYEDAGTLSQLISYRFCQIAPSYHVDPVCNLFLFSLRGREITTNSYSERCHCTTGLRCTNYRIPCEITNNLN